MKKGWEGDEEVRGPKAGQEKTQEKPKGLYLIAKQH